MGGQPVKKILVSARGISTLQVEVKFLHIRTKIPINRKGVTALTVYLLSFLVGLRCKPVFYSGCRSPPANLDYSKKFRLEVKEMSFNYGREDKKWRLWKEAEEKELRDLGVDEETIEKFHTYDWAVFNSDRRYYRRLKESGTYLEDVAEDTAQPEMRTVEDFLDSIETSSSTNSLLAWTGLPCRLLYGKWTAMTAPRFQKNAVCLSVP